MTADERAQLDSVVIGLRLVADALTAIRDELGRIRRGETPTSASLVKQNPDMALESFTVSVSHGDAMVLGFFVTLDFIDPRAVRP